MTLTAVVSAFAVGMWVGARQEDGALEARVGQLERQADAKGRVARAPEALGRSLVSTAGVGQDAATHAALAEAVRLLLVEEMGLVSPAMLRERQSSFAELYATGLSDETTYGTASYLGEGYFITVKHAVAAAATQPGSRIRLRIGNTQVRASVVDSGDADGEVDPGDWAILKVEDALAVRPLRIDLHYSYPFADPVARMGNDYSRGIIATTGHVGQHRNGLVTCLTDGHPGVSGGGVLNRAGDLVGIQVGRLEGDFRFSFILPLRAEMFRRLRRVPLDFVEPTTPGTTLTAGASSPAPPPPTRSVATGGLAGR